MKAKQHGILPIRLTAQDVLNKDGIHFNFMCVCVCVCVRVNILLLFLMCIGSCIILITEE